MIKTFNPVREPSQVEEAKPQPKVGLKQLLKVYLISNLSGLGFVITCAMVELCLQVPVHWDDIHGVTKQVHPFRLGIHSIGLSPFGVVFTWIILPIILSYHSYLRLPKACSHHSPIFAPIIKTTLVHTPQSHERSVKCPIQSLEALLLWYFPLKCIRKHIHIIQAIISG